MQTHTTSHIGLILITSDNDIFRLSSSSSCAATMSFSISLQKSLMRLLFRSIAVWVGGAQVLVCFLWKSALSLWLWVSPKPKNEMLWKAKMQPSFQFLLTGAQMSLLHLEHFHRVSLPHTSHTLAFVNLLNDFKWSFNWSNVSQILSDVLAIFTLLTLKPSST